MAILCKYVHKKIKNTAKKCTGSAKLWQKTEFLISGHILGYLKQRFNKP